MNRLDAQQASRWARIAGATYLAMGPLAIYSLSVRFGLFAEGDPVATFSQMAASQDALQLAIVTQLFSQTLFIFLPLMLYKIFHQINRSAALLMVVLALIGIPVAFANELNQFAILQLVGGSESLAAMPSEQQQLLVVLFSELHMKGLLLCHITWGAWLLPVGYLAIHSGLVPKWIGWLVGLAGVGYLVDFLLGVLWPELGVVVTPVTFVGEILFAGWLVFRGIKPSRWHKAHAQIG